MQTCSHRPRTRERRLREGASALNRRLARSHLGRGDRDLGAGKAGHVTCSWGLLPSTGHTGLPGTAVSSEGQETRPD